MHESIAIGSRLSPLLIATRAAERESLITVTFCLHSALAQ